MPPTHSLPSFDRLEEVFSSRSAKRHQDARDSKPRLLEQEMILEGHEGGRRTLARSHHLDPGVVDRLVADESVEVRSLLARNESIPLGALAVLSRDVSERVRAIVASSSMLNEPLQEALVEDSSADVLHNLAQNPVLTPRIQDEVAALPNDVWMSLADNPNVTPALQRRLCSARLPFLDGALARNPGLVDEVQMVLAARSNDQVLGHLASLSTLCEAAQHELLQASVMVRRSLGGNPGLAPAVQEALAACTDDSVKQTLAYNPALLVSLQERLSFTGSVNVAIPLAANPSLVWSERLSARFVYGRNITAFSAIIGDADRETAIGLASNWEGDMKSLVEAVGLIR